LKMALRIRLVTINQYYEVIFNYFLYKIYRLGLGV
jgi:hypothetical protein